VTVADVDVVVVVRMTLLKAASVATCSSYVATFGCEAQVKLVVSGTFVAPSAGVERAGAAGFPEYTTIWSERLKWTAGPEESPVTAMGYEPAATLAVIEQSSGQSWIGTDRLRRALSGDLAPRAHMTLLAKDTGLAVAMAQRGGFAGPLGEKAAAVFAQALQAGLGGLDDAAVFNLLRGAGRPDQ
jgi:hypothetical protein